MSRLPTDVSGYDAVKAFQKDGWTVRRIGPHIILTRAGSRAHLSVPNHKTLDPGTLRSLIRNSGLTIEEFLALL